MKRSHATFGLTDEQWEQAKAEARAAIMEAAYERRMTWYSEVAAAITTTCVEPFSAQMNYLLGDIFQEEHDASRPLLTSLVTHKHGDKEPGDGFYEMARSLGYRFSEPFVFWSTQVQKVFTAYGKPERRVDG